MQYARALARRFKSELLLIGVAEAEHESARLREYLENVVKALETLEFVAKSLVTGTAPGQTIVAVAKERESDLILIATSGRGSARQRAAIGNVIAEVMQTTPCPLLIVPAADLPVKDIEGAHGPRFL